jgi:hypothetical protein
MHLSVNEADFMSHKGPIPELQPGGMLQTPILLMIELFKQANRRVLQAGASKCCTFKQRPVLTVVSFPKMELTREPWGPNKIEIGCGSCFYNTSAGQPCCSCYCGHFSTVEERAQQGRQNLPGRQNNGSYDSVQQCRTRCRLLVRVYKNCASARGKSQVRMMRVRPVVR